jgi:hypothetical protein
MTEMNALQTKTLLKILPLMVVAEDGEITEYAARAAGAGLPQLRALANKGVLIRRMGTCVLTEGPSAGVEISCFIYSAA